MHDPTRTLAPMPTGTTHFHVAAFLARYSGKTRTAYATRLRIYLEWCASVGLDPIVDVTRPHIELYGRHLEEVRGNKPASVHAGLVTVKMFYRLLAMDGHIPLNPAENIRLPKVYVDETRLVGLGRNELGAIIAQARTMSLDHAALATLLGLLGLRVSEACSVKVEDFQSYERGYRVLHLVGKGGKPATIPLPPPVFRVLDAAAEGRTGYLLRGRDGQPLNRNKAARMVANIAKRCGIKKHVTPHVLRAAFVTNALDAGVPIRDVQVAARHSDPATTSRYDRARASLDRHAVHTLAAYVAGAA